MAAAVKSYKAEQIDNLLREMDVMTTNGKVVPEACSVRMTHDSALRPAGLWCGLRRQRQ